jgi:hypothetical protein
MIYMSGKFNIELLERLNVVAVYVERRAALFVDSTWLFANSCLGLLNVLFYDSEDVFVYPLAGYDECNLAVTIPFLARAGPIQ